MKKRWIRVLTIMHIIACLIVLTCCKKEETKMASDDYQMVYIDLNVFSNLSTEQYSISQLENYFGPVSPNEQSEYGCLSDQVHLSFDCINQVFPVEYIKQSNTISFYSSYRVVEGGRYFVFWATPTNFSTSFDVKPLTARLTVYIPSINSSNVFCSLTEKQSSAEDVFKICPSSELCFTMSSGVYSFSLLDDGIIAEIKYEKKEHLNSRKDLIVDSISFHNTEDYLDFSYLATIDPQDLP